MYFNKQLVLHFLLLRVFLIFAAQKLMLCSGGASHLRNPKYNLCLLPY